MGTGKIQHHLHLICMFLKDYIVSKYILLQIQVYISGDTQTISNQDNDNYL